MAVTLGKNDNAAAARDRPALRGLQAIVLPALRFLDRPTRAFKNAPCQHDCLKARDISELFRGSLAPDWSADWLHREAIAILELSSLERIGVPFDTLDKPEQEALMARLRVEIRENTWDSATGVITVS